jgi:hypothetical protein
MRTYMIGTIACALVGLIVVAAGCGDDCHEYLDADGNTAVICGCQDSVNDDGNTTTQCTSQDEIHSLQQKSTSAVVKGAMLACGIARGGTVDVDSCICYLLTPVGPVVFATGWDAIMHCNI